MIKFNPSLPYPTPPCVAGNDNRKVGLQQIPCSYPRQDVSICTRTTERTVDARRQSRVLPLMVIQDERLWTKAAFEASDFGTTAAVCVVTNGISDDANGCNIEQDEVWLQIVRKGDVFCTHYSLDGETFYMVRLFHLPVEQTVKVGIEAQSPAGDGGLRFYSDISLENRTVSNLRAGV